MQNEQVEFTKWNYFKESISYKFKFPYLQNSMNFVQQFLEENLYKDLGHHLLSQIQQQNSAVQCLVANLEHLRERSNSQIYTHKIKRIQTFLDLKKQILLSLQPLTTNPSLIFDWILNNFVQNGFLYELVKRENFFVQKQLIQIAKKTLLDQSYLQQHHDDIQFSKKLIVELNLLNGEKNQIYKVLNRQKINEIDLAIKVFDDKIRALQQKVVNFNTEMLLFLRKIYSFDEKIRNQFYLCFNSTPEYLESTQKIQIQHEQDNQLKKKNSQKSHLSMDSNDVRSKFTKTKQFYENDETPMKFFQTQVFEPTNTFKERKKRLALQKKTGGEEKRFIYDKQGLYENKRPVLQNKKSSIQYMGVSNKYSQITEPDEIVNLHRTLGSLNLHRPQRNNFLYTKNEQGRQIRLPTKWASNSRTSIPYYPPR